MKSAQTKITDYRNTHAGKSALIDRQMDKAEQALKDATRNQGKGDKDFVLANLYLARKAVTDLLDAIPAPDAIRKELIDIYAAIDSAICVAQER